MSRDQLTRRSRRLFDRLSEPSSAAGLAALLALLVPELAKHAPAIVDLALTALAAGAALWAIVRREGNGSNDQ
jgi:crotonobetainyl-CoA:carnitine CoA-transferase CaiB-like acyl-CoA transferase